jgi:hypothetical protein
MGRASSEIGRSRQAEIHRTLLWGKCAVLAAGEPARSYLWNICTCERQYIFRRKPVKAQNLATPRLGKSGNYPLNSGWRISTFSWSDNLG